MDVNDRLVLRGVGRELLRVELPVQHHRPAWSVGEVPPCVGQTRGQVERRHVSEEREERRSTKRNGKGRCEGWQDVAGWPNVRENVREHGVDMRCTARGPEWRDSSRYGVVQRKGTGVRVPKHTGAM